MSPGRNSDPILNHFQRRGLAEAYLNWTQSATSESLCNLKRTWGTFAVAPVVQLECILVTFWHPGHGFESRRDRVGFSHFRTWR